MRGGQLDDWFYSLEHSLRFRVGMILASVSWHDLCIGPKGPLCPAPLLCVALLLSHGGTVGTDVLSSNMS